MAAETKQTVPVEREEETGQVSAKVRRQYTGAMAVVVKAVSIILPLYCIFYILEIPGVYLHVLFYPTAFRAIFLFLAVSLIFLIYPATARSPKDRLPWYDLLLIIVALVPTLHIFLVTPSIVAAERIGATTIDQILFITILLVLGEATRRTIGKEMLWVLALFLAYIPVSEFLPGLWGSKPFTLAQITEYIYLFDSGIFGFILGIPATLIIVFITFGAFMIQAGTAKLLMNCAMALAGQFRGGPAKVAIVASMLFGAVTGSTITSVGTIGVITIPLMKKLGYKSWFAGAVESAASTGGVLLPPVMGSLAFIMAEVTGLGYTAICLAAIIPGVLYYLSLFCQLDFEAAKMQLRGLPREELPSLRQTLKEGSHLFAPPVLLVVFLMVFELRPVEAVLLAMVATILVSWVRKESRIGLTKFLSALSAGGMGILYVTPACAGSGIMNGSIALTGLGVNVAGLIGKAAGGNLLVLGIYTWIAMYLSGLAVGEIIIYIVMAIVVVPAFTALGVPVLAAHLFIFYLSVASFVTPPSCPPVFVACSIAGSGLWKTGLQAMKLACVGFFVPFLILFNPSIILLGTPTQIICGVVTSVAGVLLLSGGLEGYMFVKARWWQIVLFLVGGVSLFTPYWQINLIGTLSAIPALMVNFRSKRLIQAKLKEAKTLLSNV